MSTTIGSSFRYLHILDFLPKKGLCAAAVRLSKSDELGLDTVDCEVAEDNNDTDNEIEFITSEVHEDKRRSRARTIIYFISYLWDNAMTHLKLYYIGDDNVYLLCRSGCSHIIIYSDENSYSSFFSFFFCIALHWHDT